MFRELIYTIFELRSLNVIRAGINYGHPYEPMRKNTNTVEC
jgi:hypothetical protein